jgi:hypothetical protein
MERAAGHGQARLNSRLAAGFGIGLSTAWRYLHETARTRGIGERAVATLKTSRILTKLRCCPRPSQESLPPRRCQHGRTQHRPRMSGTVGTPKGRDVEE